MGYVVLMKDHSEEKSLFREQKKIQIKYNVQLKGMKRTTI